MDFNSPKGFHQTSYSPNFYRQNFLLYGIHWYMYTVWSALGYKTVWYPCRSLTVDNSITWPMSHYALLGQFFIVVVPWNKYMSNKSWYHHQMLQSYRGSSCIREGGRSLHLTILLKHSQWYYSHAIVSPLRNYKESRIWSLPDCVKNLRETMSLVSGLAPACNQNRTLWEIICQLHVCNCSKRETSRFLHKTKQRLPFRFILVAHLCD